MVRSIAWVLVTFLAACDGTSDSGFEGPAPEGVEPAVGPGGQFVPADSNSSPYVAGKADQFSDFKNANLPIYGITAAATALVRPAAEWESAQALVLSYTGDLPTSLNKTLTDLVKEAVDVIDLYVVTSSNADGIIFTIMLKSAGMAQAVIDAKVHFIAKQIDTIWAGDFGPISLLHEGSVGFADVRYDNDRVHDDAFPTHLGSLWGMTVYRPPLNMDGAGFQSDSQARCYITQALYWNNATSPGNIDQYLHDYLGCQAITVLLPMNGEGTGNIGFFAKILSDGHAVLGSYTASQDAVNMGILDQNETILEDGPGLTVYRIPMPSHTNDVWRSYVGSVMVNGLNLWPNYTAETDIQAEALAVWQEAAPTWTHVGVLAEELATWGGTIQSLARVVPDGIHSALEQPAPPVICNDVGCYPDLCVPACEGKECGADGCGESCGECVGAQDECMEGQCVCQAACGGKVCGDDGCGGLCGECTGAQEECVGGGCVCQAACSGKACGSDGCGGVCGDCEEGDTCTPEGQCLPPAGEDTTSPVDASDGQDASPDSDTGSPVDTVPVADTIVGADSAADLDSVAPQDAIAQQDKVFVPDTGLPEAVLDALDTMSTQDTVTVPDMVAMHDTTTAPDSAAPQDALAAEDIAPSGGSMNGGCTTSTSGTAAPTLLLVMILVTAWRGRANRRRA
ncbi:MAG: agmatine deiminase family protein [Deltaproteobacteria bacterium]|nr:agmatine deiminase family protein [Deltaproteobacteria bacterium]